MFESIGSFITNPIIAGIIGGLIIILMAYCDAKYRKIERERQTYVQLFFLSMIVVAMVTYCVLYYNDSTDEFLEQQYETVVPSLIKTSKKNGGSLILKNKKLNQSSMKEPKMNIIKMFGNLPKPGTIDNVKNIEIDIKPNK